MRKYLVLIISILASCTARTSSLTDSLPPASDVSIQPPECGAVSTLARDPAAQGSGLHMGPLWLRGFIHESGPAVIRLQPWYPTKVLIAHGRLRSSIELRGINCSTGQAIHFCYENPCTGELAGTSTDPATLAAAGTPVQTIRLGAPGDYTGYMLFTAPGIYGLAVTQGGQPRGEGVVLVRLG